MLKIRLSKCGLVAGLAVCGASLSLSLEAADPVGGRVGSGADVTAHGTPGGRSWRGGGHWNVNGWGWWGLGLGLGLGLEALYYDNPGYVYPYYPYVPPAVIITLESSPADQSRYSTPSAIVP